MRSTGCLCVICLMYTTFIQTAGSTCDRYELVGDLCTTCGGIYRRTAQVCNARSVYERSDPQGGDMYLYYWQEGEVPAWVISTARCSDTVREKARMVSIQQEPNGYYRGVDDIGGYPAEIRCAPELSLGVLIGISAAVTVVVITVLVVAIICIYRKNRKRVKAQQPTQSVPLEKFLRSIDFPSNAQTKPNHQRYSIMSTGDETDPPKGYFRPDPLHSDIVYTQRDYTNRKSYLASHLGSHAAKVKVMNPVTGNSGKEKEGVNIRKPTGSVFDAREIQGKNAHVTDTLVGTQQNWTSGSGNVSYSPDGATSIQCP